MKIKWSIKWSAWSLENIFLFWGIDGKNWIWYAAFLSYYFQGTGLQSVPSQTTATKLGPYFFNQLLSKNWRMWLLTKWKMTLSSCFTLASMKLHINDLMWKGHKDPNSQLLQKIHETFSCFAAPTSLYNSPTTPTFQSLHPFSWHQLLPEKLKCHHLMKALLEFIERVVNSSQPSAHTAVLACLMLWHCLITQLSPRLDLKKLMFNCRLRSFPQLATTYSLWGPPCLVCCSETVPEYLKKKKFEHDIIYFFGSMLFNSTLWMLTKYKVLVHIGMYLNLGNWCHGASRLSQLQ